MVVSRILAAVNDTTDRAFKEGVDGIIKEVEGNKSILVLILYFLRCLLEAGEHGTLTAGKVLARIAVFPNLSQYLLNNDELVRHKGEGGRKLRAIRKALDVQYRIVKGVEVFQDSVFLVVHHAEKLLSLFGLCQHTLFDDLINGRRGQTEAGVEASLNLGKVIAGDMDNGVDCLLARNHHPDFAHAAGSDFFHKGLQIDHQIPVVTDILTNLVHHEQQTEVLALTVHIFFDICDELGDAQFIRLFAVEPVPGGLLAHAEDRLQYLHNIVFKEGKGVPRFHPRCAIDFFKGSAELLGLALLFNKAFQLGNLQIVSIEAAVVIEHLGKDAQNSGLIFRDRTLNVDIKQNGLRRHRDTLDRSCVHHGVVKFVCEIVHCFLAADFLVFKKVG